MQGQHPFYVAKKWERYKNRLNFINMLVIQIHTEQLTFQY